MSGCQLPAIVCVKAQETPSNERPCGDLCILINVLWIIEGDEFMSQGLTKNQPLGNSS